MNRNLCHFAALVGLFLAAGDSFATFSGPQPVKSSMRCEGHRDGWLMNISRPGLNGAACRAQAYGNALRLNVLYDEFIVDSRHLLKVEGEGMFLPESETYLRNYLIRVLNLIDQMAQDHYRAERSKIPDPVTSAEVEMWKTLVKVTGYHESHFTHYQKDGSGRDEAEKLKVMMGDPEYERVNGAYRIKRVDGFPIYHSQGMFQRHDRRRAQKGVSRSVDLVVAAQEAIEKLYGHWAAVLGYRPDPIGFARCRDKIRGAGGIDYLNAALAAYALYNGGSVCRFYDSRQKHEEYKTKNSGCDIDKYYPGPNGEQKKQACINAYMRPGSNFAPSWVNDVRFMRIFDQQPWTEVVSDTERALMRKGGRHRFSFNLSCARSGQTHCLEGENLNTLIHGRIKENLKGRLFTTTQPNELKPDRSYCVYQADTESVYCTQREAYIPCLRNLQEFPLYRVNEQGSQKLKEAYFRLDYLQLDENLFRPVTINDPRVLCSGLGDGVLLSGEFVRAVRDRKVYANKDFGRHLTTMVTGEVAQVLDSEVVVETGFDRWYRVSRINAAGEPVEGWIYGGDDVDWETFVATAEPEEIKLSEIIIPRAGDIVVAERNANVFAKPARTIENEDELIAEGLVPAGAMMTVKEVHIIGADQAIYLTVEWEPRGEGAAVTTGIVAAGQIRTNLRGGVMESVRDFVRVIRAAEERY